MLSDETTSYTKLSNSNRSNPDHHIGRPQIGDHHENTESYITVRPIQSQFCIKLSSELILLTHGTQRVQWDPSLDSDKPPDLRYSMDYLLSYLVRQFPVLEVPFRTFHKINRKAVGPPANDQEFTVFIKKKIDGNSKKFPKRNIKI